MVGSWGCGVVGWWGGVARSRGGAGSWRRGGGGVVGPSPRAVSHTAIFLGNFEFSAGCEVMGSSGGGVVGLGDRGVVGLWGGGAVGSWGCGAVRSWGCGRAACRALQPVQRDCVRRLRAGEPPAGGGKNLASNLNGGLE